MKDPYLYTLWTTTNYPTEEALQAAETAMMRLIQNFKKPSQDAVKLAIKALDFQWKAAMEGTKNLTMEINEAISRGDAFDVFNRFSILHEITPEDVLRVAQEYFDTQKLTVVTYSPGKFLPKSYMKMDYKTPEYDVSPDVLKKPDNATLNFSQPVSYTHLTLPTNREV